MFYIKRLINSQTVVVADTDKGTEEQISYENLLKRVAGYQKIYGFHNIGEGVMEVEPGKDLDIELLRALVTESNNAATGLAFEVYIAELRSGVGFTVDYGKNRFYTCCKAGYDRWCVDSDRLATGIPRLLNNSMVAGCLKSVRMDGLGFTIIALGKPEIDEVFRSAIN